MRGGLRSWESGDWLLVALGGGGGVVWGLASFVVGIQWWGAATLPWWAGALRLALLWPLMAAIGAWVPGADPFALTLGIGAATGALGGALLAWRLRR